MSIKETLLKFLHVKYLINDAPIFSDRAPDHVLAVVHSLIDYFMIISGLESGSLAPPVALHFSDLCPS